MSNPLMDELYRYLPAACVLIVLLVLLKSMSILAAKQRLSADYRRTLLPQFLIVAIAVVGVLILLLLLPIEAETRGQVLGLFGVVFTGIIALSSTTFVTNALAGFMLRLIRNYKAGDFIRVNSMFGRITERGLFHTEIQTAERDLTTFPNLYLITNPLTVVRSSGTVVSATLSLGYDVPHQQVEPLLIAAAEQTGLEEPFSQILKLGDFSITYKISGFLHESKQLLAMQSKLKRAVLNGLHGAGIEIVSPNFMNQRVLADDVAMIPPAIGPLQGPSEESEALPGDLIFDKAEIAQERRQLQEKLDALAQKRSALHKAKDPSQAEAVKKIEAAMERIEKRIEAVDEMLKTDDEKRKTSKK
ncbi:MAG: mechanosensitive ion channel [Desulfobacteraceae bacterium]